MQKSLNLFRNLIDWYHGLGLPSHVHHPLPREGRKVSYIVSRKEETHPKPSLGKGGGHVSCAEHTEKDFSSFTSHFSQLCTPHPSPLPQGAREQLSWAKHTEKHLFSYSPIHLFTFKKAAFTLAEVLITLAIIGVVAALTLPTLIKNYQKQVYVNQLKSAYSTLGQGFKKMLADEGVDSLSDIPEFANADGCSVGDNTRPKCVALTNKLQKYFKFTVVSLEDVWNFAEDVKDLGDSYSQQYGAVVSGAYDALIFSNNFLITMSMYGGSSPSPQLTKDLGGHITSYIAGVDIDINGYKKGPNTLGRDYFLFVLGNDGNLYPYHGIDFALIHLPRALELNGMYWRRDRMWCGEPNSSDIEDIEGWGCAARIIENGWKMDY